MLDSNKIFIGDVYHKRHTPFIHDFKYRVFSLWVNLDDLDNSRPSPKYFSFNRWNILSLHKKDHGPRNGTSIRTWIESAAKEKDIDIEDGKIYMMCFPRVLGYVFNPLTVYFCYNRDGVLTALLHQVKNTFGEQHGYLLAVTNNSKTIKQDTSKIFHVSPFIQMDSHYYFHVKEPTQKGFSIAIHQTIPTGKMLTATWTGNHALDLNSKNILKVFFTIPLMTIKIILTIHMQALKLWLKGAKFIKSPPVPNKDIS
jgi:uncharacterized protein